MRLLDKTILTEDEGWNIERDVGQQIENALRNIRPKLDAYNAQYVIRVTVDSIDPIEPEPKEDDDE